MHSNTTTGVRRSQDEVSDNWQCQVMNSYKIRRVVHGSVRARLRVKNSYKFRPEVHISATAGARQ